MLWDWLKYQTQQSRLQGQTPTSFTENPMMWGEGGTNYQPPQSEPWNDGELPALRSDVMRNIFWTKATKLKDGLSHPQGAYLQGRFTRALVSQQSNANTWPFLFHTLAFHSVVYYIRVSDQSKCTTGNISFGVPICSLFPPRSSSPSLNRIKPPWGLRGLEQPLWLGCRNTPHPLLWPQLNYTDHLHAP